MNRRLQLRRPKCRSFEKSHVTQARLDRERLEAASPKPSKSRKPKSP